MFKTYVSTDEFMLIALDPANANRRLQRIDGEVFELISSNHSSQKAANIAGEIGIIVRPHALGRITSSNGGYSIGGEQYIPDCTFVSYQLQPHSTIEAYPEIAPDLVVEVLSPGNIGSTDEREKLARKVAN